MYPSEPTSQPVTRARSRRTNVATSATTAANPDGVPKKSLDSTKKVRKATVRPEAISAASEVNEAAVHDRIAERAYELWETQGRPHGNDLLNWHQAERDLRASLVQDSPPADADVRKRPVRPRKPV